MPVKFSLNVDIILLNIVSIVYLLVYGYCIYKQSALLEINDIALLEASHVYIRFNNCNY